MPRGLERRRVRDRGGGVAGMIGEVKGRPSPMPPRYADDGSPSASESVEAIPRQPYRLGSRAQGRPDPELEQKSVGRTLVARHHEGRLLVPKLRGGVGGPPYKTGFDEVCASGTVD